MNSPKPTTDSQLFYGIILLAGCLLAVVLQLNAMVVSAIISIRELIK